jgi:two-component system LytT family response regulator
LKQHLKQAPVFVFISSHAEYAAESYSLDVIDFIVKPVSLARLMKAASKAIEYIELKKKAAAEGTVAGDNTAAVMPPSASDHFYIKESYDFVRLQYDDVIYIESMGNFSNLHTVQKKKHITLVSLKNIEEQLPADQFVRVHKQYLVNLKHVISVSSDNHVSLTDGSSLPVGQMHKGGLMEVIAKRMLQR